MLFHPSLSKGHELTEAMLLIQPQFSPCTNEGSSTALHMRPHLPDIPGSVHVLMLPPTLPHSSASPPHVVSPLYLTDSLDISQCRFAFYKLVTLKIPSPAISLAFSARCLTNTTLELYLILCPCKSVLFSLPPSSRLHYSLLPCLRLCLL